MGKARLTKGLLEVSFLSSLTTDKLSDFTDQSTGLRNSARIFP
jgi:hypothetical protein